MISPGWPCLVLEEEILEDRVWALLLLPRMRWGSRSQSQWETTGVLVPSGHTYSCTERLPLLSPHWAGM